MNPFNIGDCWLFSEGIAAVKIKNHYGFIDKRGDVVIEPKYDDACGFSDGLAAVKVGKKYGFIDHTGRMVIEPQFGFGNDQVFYLNKSNKTEKDVKMGNNERWMNQLKENSNSASINKNRKELVNFSENQFIFSYCN